MTVTSDDRPPESVERPPCTAVDSPGTVQVWHAMGGATAAAVWQQWESDFEAESDIDLTVRVFGNDGDLFRELANSTPDDWPQIVISNERSVRALWDSGRFIAPTSCDPSIGDDLLPIAAATYTVDGVLAAVPFAVSTLVLVADLTEVRTAGLDPERPPETLEQLLEWSRRIVSTGTSPHGLVLTDHCANMVINDYSGMRGIDVGIPDNGRSPTIPTVRFDSPDNIVDFSEFRSAVQQGHVSYIGPNASSFDDLVQISPLDGNATMTLHTSAALGDVIALLEAGNFPGGELGVMPLPGPGDGAPVGGNALYLVSDEDPVTVNRAWSVISWLHQPEQRAALAAATGYVPATRSAADVDVLRDAWSDRPELEVAYRQILRSEASTAMAGLSVGPFDEIDYVLYNLCERIMTGDGDIGAQLQTAASTTNQLITAYAALRNGDTAELEPSQEPVEITGVAACESGARVVGVWVEAANGGSAFAERERPDQPRTAFSTVLPFGGVYELHIGCGGSENDWGGSYFSPSLTGSGHVIVCDDTPARKQGECSIE